MPDTVKKQTGLQVRLILMHDGLHPHEHLYSGFSVLVGWLLNNNLSYLI